MNFFIGFLGGLIGSLFFFTSLLVLAWWLSRKEPEPKEGDFYFLTDPDDDIEINN